MNYPIGLDRDSQGKGTEPKDIQSWIWSLYRTAGTIARGLEVTGTSTMQYQVQGGIAILSTGDRLAIAVPISATTVATPSAPSTGSRTDYIYVGQDGAVQVGTTQPAGTALIDKRKVPAGITATTATTTLLGNRQFAPLYGSSMGQIASWKDPLADLATIPDARSKVGTLTFTIDSDRRIEMHLQVSYDQRAEANTDWKVGSFVWEIWINGKLRRSSELAVHSWAETKQNRFGFDLTAGTYTVDLYRERRLTSGGLLMHRVGGSAQWPGTTFTITDLGGLS